MLPTTRHDPTAHNGLSGGPAGFPALRARVQVVEIRCKSLLNKVQSSLMPFRWSINPYRGCQHACVYCYARRYHEYLGLNAGPDFERRIYAKVNAVEVLRKELGKLGEGEWVAIGTAVDPYQPIEGRYKLSRGILQTLSEFGVPCSLVTKNSMIIRDIDVLQDLARGPGCRVYFSITTMNPALARRLEPDTSPPLARLQTMKALSEAGVDVGVMIAPVIPGVTDSQANLNEVARYASEYGARRIAHGILRLQGSVKGVFKEFIRARYPSLVSLYEWLYPNDYLRSGYRRGLQQRIATATRNVRLDSGAPLPAPSSSPSSPSHAPRVVTRVAAGVSQASLFD